MQQQFACSPPPRIKIRKIPAWTRVRFRVSSFMRDEHALHVEPHTARAQQRNQQSELRNSAQNVSKRSPP
jgi:hypothetical protein